MQPVIMSRRPPAGMRGAQLFGQYEIGITTTAHSRGGRGRDGINPARS
jgi:hypothetical protein